MTEADPRGKMGWLLSYLVTLTATDVGFGPELGRPARQVVL